MAQPASTRDIIPGFGERLSALREQRGLSQAQLAGKAGTHPTTVSKLEKGLRSPSLRLARDLAHALGITLDHLLP